MNVIIVYELVWGNTAAVARAIAEDSAPMLRRTRPTRYRRRSSRPRT